MSRNHRKGSEIFLLKCKQWCAYKVSVNTVRVLYGVMVVRRATGWYVVTSGKFTDNAKEIVSGRNIELLEGKALHAMIQSSDPSGPPRRVIYSLRQV